ncbi:glycosyltransferase family 2 protein, partial [Teratosphaeria destructans]
VLVITTTGPTPVDLLQSTTNRETLHSQSLHSHVDRMGSSDRVDTMPYAQKDAPIDISSAPNHEAATHPVSLHAKSWIEAWTPTALMVTYLVFSISLYTVLDSPATKVFWFLYLTIATLKAGITALEAYDGLTPLREARKADEKATTATVKAEDQQDELPLVHLIFDSSDSEFSAPAELLANIEYPDEKLAVTFLRSSQAPQRVPVIEYIGSSQQSRVRTMTLPTSCTGSLAARVAYSLDFDVLVPDASITAVFGSDGRPHPQAIRRAAERFHQDTKLDVVNGRRILVPRSRRFGLSTVAGMLQDMLSALLQPGSAITWDLKRANESTAFWRTEALKAVARAAASVTGDGHDLAWSSVACRCKADSDMRVISYAPGPTAMTVYWNIVVNDARKAALATLRYSSLAFEGLWISQQPAGQKLNFKARVGVSYALIASHLVSHAMLQYFCLAFSTLITNTPNSASDLAQRIYFHHPVSEWLIISGLICLGGTIAMLCRARSEFVPWHTIPAVVTLYPLILLLQASVDVFGQFDAIAGHVA